MGNRARIRQDAMSLNPIDDALFQKMAEDTEFCQEILQVILNDKALQVMDNVPQFMLKNLQGRSCILDVKCTLGMDELSMPKYKNPTMMIINGECGITQPC